MATLKIPLLLRIELEHKGGCNHLLTWLDSGYFLPAVGKHPPADYFNAPEFTPVLGYVDPVAVV